MRITGKDIPSNREFPTTTFIRIVGSFVMLVKGNKGLICFAVYANYIKPFFIALKRL